MKLEKDKVYTADIELSWLESMASNGTIENKLTTAGFTEVTVWGDGMSRIARGKWPHETREVTLPKQIKNVS